jgi:hypothetical protein
MRYLKMYESFNEEDIHDICKKYNIKNYTINDDNSIDVNGDVYLQRNKLTKLPLRFRNVTGNFYCKNNRLITLEGCPEMLGGDFYCDYNNLKSLKGSPKIIGGNFYCNDNINLISMEGFNNCRYKFICHNTPIYEIYKLFKDPSKIELFNDYDCIRIENGIPTLILDRLNDFLNEIRIVIKNVDGYNCI